MTKVLHVITTTDVGGAETMLYRLLSQPNRMGIEPIVVSLLPIGPIGDSLAEIGVEVRSLDMRKGIPDPKALIRLHSLLRRAKPDIVVSWLHHADLIATLAKLAAGTWPLLWNIRASSRYFAADRPRIPIIHRVLARLSHIPVAVIVNSEAGLKYHQSIGYCPRRWHFIPNGIDVRRFKPDPHAPTQLRAELKLSSTTKLIGMPARYHPMKGHRVFIAAAAELAKERSDVEFVFCGNGMDWDNNELRELISRHQLTQRVHLLGVRRDMERIYPGTDLVTLPSLCGEGFPNVVGEAMACGTLCIVSDIGDAAAIVGNTGTVLPAGDHRALLAAWLHLLDLEPDRRHQLGELARSSIEQRYSLPFILQRYQQVIAEHSSG